MRRAQSVRHYGRPSIVQGTDDLGLLKETDESPEEALRRELIEKDRENDKLQDQIRSLQKQLSQRPPLETIQELEKEYKHLELLLQGTQRENERCMTELERGKSREKMLERELAKIVGENWQSALNISPSPTTFATHSRLGSTLHGQRSNSSPVSDQVEKPSAQASVDATMAYVDQVRLLILGMEERLQMREEKLTKSVEKAEKEGAKFEEMRKLVLSS